MDDLKFVRTKLSKFIQNPNIDYYRSDNYVVLDFETTVEDKGSALCEQNRIVLACWSKGKLYGTGSEHGQGRVVHRVRSVRGGEYELGELVEDIKRADFLVCHNAKFELQWLERCGLDLSTVLVWDTMLGEYVIGGNRYAWSDLSLDNTAQRRFGEGKDTIISRMFEAGVCSSEMPEEWLLEYCIKDVQLCERIFLAQREEMERLCLMHIMLTRCLLVPVLADIEKNGVTLDEDKVIPLREQKEKEYSDVLDQLTQATGGINTNSPKQLAEFLYVTLGFAQLKDRRGRVKTTPKGNPLTNATAISQLKARNSKQREFIELHKRSKGLYNELTKYLRKFDDCCKGSGGNMRAVFNQTRTKTHRLSSSGAKYTTQFQNFPRIYKPLFKARHKGWKVGEGDGAQLEFRVAAHLGRDSVALDDITQGTDIHSVTAGIIGCSRQDAKAHTFKPLYGGRSGTPEEMKYYDFFRRKYSSITSTQTRWIDEVLTKKYLVTEWGMRYYWPDTRMMSSGYVTNRESICNYPVQGLATAEIIPIALVYFWHYLKAMGAQMFIVNTIHDSIICELPEEEEGLFHELNKKCLIDEVYEYLDNVYNIKFTVPLACGVVVGDNWGGEEETVYTAKESQYAS